MDFSLTPHFAGAGAQPATSSAPSNALFTLLGVAITGIITISAVLIKYRLDKAAEKRHQEHELAKLEMQLDASREDADRERRRKVFAVFLSQTHTIFTSIDEARGVRRGEGEESYLKLLQSVNSTEAQVALEECRLEASMSVNSSAGELWNHLRSHDVPRGAKSSYVEYRAWKEEYWVLRKQLIKVFQMELARAPRDAQNQTSGTD